jgi:uncharacterized protein YjbI with pentapeptide repeats
MRSTGHAPNVKVATPSHFSSALLAAVFGSLLLGAPALAQTPATEPARERTPALPLTCDVTSAGMDSSALRAAIERELSLPVRFADDTDTAARLAITASSQTAVDVRFIRADGSSIERTVDVSNAGTHSNETLALVAANLMRDEASDLLDALRAAQPAPAPPPPTAATTPAPPPEEPPPPPLPHGCDPNDLRQIPIGLDVAPYLGMSYHDRTSVERKFSLGLFGNLSGAVRGAEFGGFVNLVDHSVCGAQFTAGVNLVGGPVRGVQFGMANLARGRVDGGQFGMLSFSGGPLRGAQYGLVNFVRGPIEGAQFGLVQAGIGPLKGAQFGLVNLAAGDIQGGQFGLVNAGIGSIQGTQLGLVGFARGDFIGLQAGLAQVTRGSFTGAQLGLANVTVRDFTGPQIGLANVSGGPTQGLQLGLANVTARRMHGAMIGLVNVAEDSEAAIGLINVLWRGQTHLDVWGTDYGVASIGLVHGGSKGVHNIYSFGITGRHDRAVFAPSFGIGVSAARERYFFVDIDLLSTWLFYRDSDQKEWDASLIGTLRVPVGFRFTPEVALFISPTLNVSVAPRKTNSLEDPSLIGGARLTPADKDVLVRLWPGFMAGVRFF